MTDFMALKTIKCLIIVLCALGWYCPLAQEYAVKSFTVDDGLPSSHVYEVKQDKQGFYWICTSEGLTKYDGYSFKLIRPRDASFSQDIWWTYQDRDDRVWMLNTGTDLWYIEQDSFKIKPVYYPEMSKDVSFRKLSQDTSGYYWLIAGSRFFSFKDENFNSYKATDLSKHRGAAKPAMHCKNGEVSFITKLPLEVWGTNSNGELHKRHSYNIRVYEGADTPEGAITWNEANTTIVYHTQDTLYVIHHNQLIGCFNGREFDLGLFPSVYKLGDKSYKVLSMGDKYAFINSAGSFMTDAQFNHLPEFDFIGKYNINTIYEDYEGSIWISTTDKGLLYLTKDALAAKSYSYIEGLNSEVIGIETDDNGVKWVAFKNGNLISYDNGELKKHYITPVNTRDKNWFLRHVKVVDGYLILAVGNYEIQVFKPENGLREPLKVYRVDHTKAMNAGADGNVYIADFGKIYRLSMKGSLPDELSMISYQRVLSASADKLGELIISSFGGVDKSNDNKTELLAPGLHTKKVKVDKHKDLWLLLKGRGVRKLVNDSIIVIKALENVLVNDVYFEGDKTLWVASNEGLIKYTYDDSIQDYRYSRKLTLANGLLTNEVTSILSDDEYLYVGTAKGFNVINKSRLSTVEKGNAVYLTSVSSKGNPLGVKSNYTLQPDFNALDFSFVYISPKSEGQITYEYKLDGIDKDWKTTNKTSVSYPFLPAGDYQFLLRAYDINGIQSIGIIMLQIELREYWWKTDWFRFMLVLVLVLLVVAFYRIRIRQLKNREKERNELNNRMAELKLNALQSQMDPHFIFNVLNSVQDSFINNDVMEANKYLTDFAKLMRLFLDSSDNKYIALTKEVKLLTHYVELERMRVQGKFDYDFSIDDNIDTDEMYVPSMLLQPIVENSIKHGLRYKEGQGQLLVEIKQDDAQALHIVIEDNGIGREKAGEIRSKRGGGHMGKATGIMQERIGIINNSNDGHIEMKYVDLWDEKGAAGTRVELMIDLKINK